MGNQGTIGYNCPLTGEPRTIPAAQYQEDQPLPISAAAEAVFTAAGYDWRALWRDGEKHEKGYGTILLRSKYRALTEAGNT